MCGSPSCTLHPALCTTLDAFCLFLVAATFVSSLSLCLCLFVLLFHSLQSLQSIARAHNIMMSGDNHRHLIPVPCPPAPVPALHECLPACDCLHIYFTIYYRIVFRKSHKFKAYQVGNLYIFNMCGMFSLVKGKNLLIYFPINNTHALISDTFNIWIVLHTCK